MNAEMINFALFSLLGYIQMVLLMAIVLNFANVKWTVPRLFITMALIYIPHQCLEMHSLLSIFTWPLLAALVYKIAFKQPWRKSIFMAIAGQYFIAAALDYIFVFTATSLPETLQYFLFKYGFTTRSIFAVIYALIFIFTRKFTSKESPAFNYFTSKYWVYYLAFFSLFIIFDTHHLSNVQFIVNLTDIFSLTLFFALFIHSLCYVKTDYKLQCAQRELKAQKLFSDSMLGFKHDFNGIVNTINGLINSGDSGKLNSYMEELTGQINLPKTIEMPESVTEIPILRGILLEKVLRAQLKGIKFNIEISEESIELKYCSDLDYSRMVSILLDNALEAAGESAEKTMEFHIKTENKKLVSTISNSCDKEVNINRIFEQGYSTKQPPSGEGLHQLRLIQDKYKEMNSKYSIEINTVLKDNVFTQVLKI